MQLLNRRGTIAVIGLSLVIAAWWVFVAQPASNAQDGGGQGGDAVGGEVWRVVNVIDGDTLDAERDGVTQRVRLIGIDTPEREACGYAQASAGLAALVDGALVTLVPGATTDADDYGRLLRYVEFDGTDAGLALIEDGLAVARYDSRSGKPHPREEQYRAADDAAADLCA